MPINFVGHIIFSFDWWWWEHPHKEGLW